MSQLAAARRRHDNRLAHIDCLRAIAALMVVAHHFIDSSFKLTSTDGKSIEMAWVVALYEYVDLGRLGVLLFFIISGYCIANSILRPSGHPVVSFALNRIARLYPAYWVSIAVGLVLFGIPQMADFIARLLLVQYFLGYPDGLGVYWTLAIELIFYGLCVALFVAGVMDNMRRLTTVWSILILWSVLASVLRAAAGIPVPYAVVWFLALMVGGAILRKIDDLQVPSPGMVWGVGGATVASALIIALCIYGDPTAYEKSWQRDFIANAAAVGLFFAANYIYRFRITAIAYLGKISYSIYLFHLLVFEVAVIAFASHLGGSGTVGAVSLIGGALGATILISAVVYWLVEMPGIRLGRRVVNALALRLPGSASMSGLPGERV